MTNSKVSMKKKSLLFSVMVLIVAFGAQTALALTPPITVIYAEDRMAVEQGIPGISESTSYAYIPAEAHPVPTVVEYKIPIEADEQFILYDNNEKRFYEVLPKVKTSYDIVVTRDANVLSGLSDQDQRTFVDLPMGEGVAKGKTQLRIDLPRPTKVHTVYFDTDENGGLVQTITVDGIDVSGEQVRILVDRPLGNTRSSYVSFPEQEIVSLSAELTYAQPVRLREFGVSGYPPLTTNTMRSVRFLAQPNHSYLLYSSKRGWSDNVEIIKGSNLYDDMSVVTHEGELKFYPNPYFAGYDVDGDGVTDEQDNCSVIPNKDQNDIDQNQVGDACEDFDRDGNINSQDNCPNTPSYSQIDVDNDGIGDICDNYDDRFTERNTWVPWVGIGAAVVVLVVLFVLVARHKPEDVESTKEGE